MSKIGLLTFFDQNITNVLLLSLAIHFLDTPVLLYIDFLVGFRIRKLSLYIFTCDFNGNWVIKMSKIDPYQTNMIHKWFPLKHNVLVQVSVYPEVLTPSPQVGAQYQSLITNFCKKLHPRPNLPPNT